MNAHRSLEEAVYLPEFLPKCADIVSRITTAKDGAEVGALLAQAAALFGADAAAFASFMQDDETYASYRFIPACDAAWCLEYESGAHFMHDPWLEYGRHHSEPVLGERIKVRTQRERQVVELARRFGFESALVVPAQAPQGLTRIGGLCLGSAQPGYFDSEAFGLATFAATPLALRVHEWQVGQLRQELIDRAQLSETDIVLLRHARIGQGSKEIAAALKLNPAAVDSRWQRLNARLGVSSRISASSMAAEYGLI